MLNFEEIDKHVDRLDSIFREENEGRHVKLVSSHRAYRSGTIEFEFDIHVKEFRLTTDRNENLSLLIVLTCQNATLFNRNADLSYPLPETPMIEYYENLMDEKPGQFDIINKNDIMLSPGNYELFGEEWRETNDYLVNKLFDYYEEVLNADSNYNINLSRIVHQDEIQARNKAEQLRKEQEQKELAKQARKEKFAANLEEAKTGAKIAGVVAAAVVFAPIAPVILLTGILSYCVVNLFDDSL